jgi:DNA-binding NtrC family response regulator
MQESIKILVVDDNEEFCRNVADILELKGHQATTIHDGFQAIEAVKQHEFDLALMDIKMPNINGVDTFRRIKAIKSDLPVIMVTAFAVEDLIRESLLEGAFGILRKPIDFDDFLEHIERTQPNGALILVVDDDENTCNNLKDILTQHNFRVSTAFNCEEAVEMTRRNNFEIILLDMKLPPLNGLETYLAIREIRPNVTVVLITGYGDEMSDLTQRAIRSNAYDCLEKPVDIDRLLEMMDHIAIQKRKGIQPEKPDN